MRISDWSSDVCSSDLGGLEDSEKNKRSISPHPWRFPPFGREEWPRRLPAIFGGPTTCIRGRSAREHLRADRKSVVEGKSVSVRVALGGRRIIKKKKNRQQEITHTTE